jgi:hypothetical protein
MYRSSVLARITLHHGPVSPLGNPHLYPQGPTRALSAACLLLGLLATAALIMAS